MNQLYTVAGVVAVSSIVIGLGVFIISIIL